MVRLSALNLPKTWHGDYTGGSVYVGSQKGGDDVSSE